MARSVFNDVLNNVFHTQPPIWLMRQAGRYHGHYQSLKKNYTFEQLCKDPELSCETAMGPMNDFGFDAAILFSDILFPLEAVGIPLSFNPAPQLGFLLRSKDDLQRLAPAVEGYFDFQRQALSLLRAKLPEVSGLIGFVGGPLTLYAFALWGTMKGDACREIVFDALYSGFMDLIIPVIADSIELQVASDPDVMAILDTSVGLLNPSDFKTYYVPVLQKLFAELERRKIDVPYMYYGKGIDADIWKIIADESLPIRVLGIDASHSLPQVLREWGRHFIIQGNFPPEYMTLPSALFLERLDRFIILRKHRPTITNCRTAQTYLGMNRPSDITHKIPIQSTFLLRLP